MRWRGLGSGLGTLAMRKPDVGDMLEVDSGGGLLNLAFGSWALSSASPLSQSDGVAALPL